MPAQNGTLRLVAANPEPVPAGPVGLGTPTTDAYAALQTAIQNLQASANQFLSSNPGNTLASSVSQQAGSISQAANDWANKLATEVAAAAKAQIDNATAAATAMSAQNAAQLATIKTLQNQLQAAGIQPTAPGRTAGGGTAPPATTMSAAGTFTTGQAAAATVFGAIAGWFGHTWYEEYRGKHR